MANSPFLYTQPTIFPPPTHTHTQQSNPNFSPLVIALIGILAGAFLLVSYYTIIAKYCTKWDAFRHRAREDHENNDPFHQQAPPGEWPVLTRGLEQSVINSLPAFKYRRGDGPVDDNECAVCLSEFQEDESLRLLPKCTHAFHLPCIDMWLSTHSNCPLCRANIVASLVSPPVEVVEIPPEEVSESTVDSPLQNPSENEAGESSLHEESGQGMAIEAPTEIATSHIRAQSDLVSKHGRNDSTSQCKELFMSAEMPQIPMRRSFSVDSTFSISVTDLHRSLEDRRLKPFSSENEGVVGVSSSGYLGNGGSEALCSVDEAEAGASSSVQPFKAAEEQHLKVFGKQLDGEKNKSSMKRSFSGGRFFFLRNGRGRNTSILPT